METWDPTGEKEQQSVIDALNRALDLGLNYIDTAPSYGDGISEEVLGRVIAKRRDECVVATKVSSYHPESVVASAENSLRRLQTDVIDILQFHGGTYPEEDLQVILNRGGLEALQKLQDQGKIRFLGFTAELPSGGASRLVATGAFDVMQVRYNFMYQDSCDFMFPGGLMHEAELQGMGIVAMRPLTSGIFQRLMPSLFPQLAGADLAGFLLNYVLSNPLVDVAIVGMRRASEVEQNNAISDNTALRLDLERVHRRFFPGQL
jgi:aryl-alcohol dehydrogenase-like predicted oxidoreductase